MADSFFLEGLAAPIPLANLDTDQIMPKQFLRGIDKSGLAQGLLYDMRFDSQGAARPDFVLNRPEYGQARILIAHANFGCGSSREHAVWGLLQYGIQAVIAPSFGEIFYSNAMNNRLLPIMLSEAEVQAIMADASDPKTAHVAIDIQAMTVRSHSCLASFSMARRHRDMFMQGLDMIGASLQHQAEIDAFAAGHWAQQPWLKNVAAMTRERLSRREV